MKNYVLGLCSVLAFISCKTPEKPAAPIAPPSVQTFTVSKTRIAKGESVNFEFATQRAKAVAIVDQDGKELVNTFDAETQKGSATATLNVTSFFILRADGEGGRDTAFVQVAVDEPLRSLFLIAVPAVVNAGESVDLVWSAPGGQNVKVLAGTTNIGMGAQGTVRHVPTLSTKYVLSAQDSAGTRMAETSVRVVPVIKDFSSLPAAAVTGKTIRLDWNTQGAESVELSEATFGTLFTTADLAQVSTGSFDFVIPSLVGDAGVMPVDDAGTVDAGVNDGGVIDAGTMGPQMVQENYPLKFTLRAKTMTPAQEVSRSLNGLIGSGPVIDDFVAPSFASKDNPQTVSWQTTGATRIEIWANGFKVFSPAVGAALDGNYVFSAINENTTIELRAYDFNQLFSSRRMLIKAIMQPEIVTFTAPVNVASALSDVNCVWSTKNATSVIIRVLNGPALFFTDAQGQVNMGSTMLRVGSEVTLVLEARNFANDFASAQKTVKVAAPTLVTFDPPIGSSASPVSATWDVTSLSPLDLLGLSNSAPQVVTASNDFIDISTSTGATKLFIADKDKGSTSFRAPDGFSFPFLVGQYSNFSASANGVLFLGPGLAANANQNMSAPAFEGPAQLAAFWDDLDLGADGFVSYLLTGNSFPRVLIVQWSKVNVPAVAGSELTFQIQLKETGEFSYLYKTMTNVDTSSVTIGVAQTPNFKAGYAFNTAGAVGEGSELKFFNNNSGESVGNRTFTLGKPSSFGFFSITANNKMTYIFGSARIISPGAILVNEVMPVPNSSATEGKWVELYNPGADTLDISDLELTSSTAMAPFVIPFGTSIDAGSYIVIGESTDMAVNGEAPVALSWPLGTFPLLDSDTVTLQVPGMPPAALASYSWNSSAADGGMLNVPGTSVQPGGAAVGATGAALPCMRAKMFGSLMQIGSPGQANDRCFEYTLTSIPVQYEDISTMATGLVTTASDQDDAVDTIMVSPFPYFGQMVSQVTVSTNGWLMPGITTVFERVNRVLPSTTTVPVGAIAPFWDDLDMDLTYPGENIYVLRKTGYTIISWHRGAIFGSTTDEVNFQVKIFDSGIIEFHYGTMISGSATTKRGEGGSATAWLERPTGVPAALAIIRNTSFIAGTPLIAPNSAYRFSPF